MGLAENGVYPCMSQEHGDESSHFQTNKKNMFLSLRKCTLFSSSLDGGPHKSHDVVIHKLKNIPYRL